MYLSLSLSGSNALACAASAVERAGAIISQCKLFNRNEDIGSSEAIVIIHLPCTPSSSTSELSISAVEALRAASVPLRAQNSTSHRQLRGP